MGGGCRAQGSQAGGSIPVRLAFGGGHARLHVARRVVLHRAAAPTAPSNASVSAGQQAEGSSGLSVWSAARSAIQMTWKFKSEVLGQVSLS